ncbi:MAG: helix-turn-helix transcriptional regulator [Sphingomonas sp.]|nr:helix-turn-helix transcriptional regulator [Sphingomonas sp.]
MKLIPTTIVAPRLRLQQFSRSSIEALTRCVDQSRLTVLSAPAGYGKTSAALHWFNRLVAEGRPGLWIASRVGIRDLSNFLFALQQAGMKAGLPWAGLGPQDDSDTWISHLSAHMEARPLIVVDDAQFLPAEVLDFLNRCITGARDAITTVIASRSAAGIPLARMRAAGFLVEIGSDELRLTVNEAEELLSILAGAPIDSQVRAEIVRVMDGWVSGLVVAGEHLRGRAVDQRKHAPLASGQLAAEIASYFREEVLRPLPSRLHDFVIATSILDELTPQACAAVLDDNDAGITLEEAHRIGLFIEKVKDKKKVYTYHPLFRTLIRETAVDRSPAQVAEYHRRVSRYFVGAQEECKAIQHAHLSEDVDFLADQLNLLSNKLIYDGYLYFVEEHSANIPWSVLKSRPMLLLALAWRRIRRLSLVQAERYITCAAEIAAEQPDDITLAYVLRHRQILLQAAHDNLHYVESEGERLLLELGDEAPYLSCTLVGQLMAARREFYHFRDIVKLEAETRRALSRPGSEFAAITLKATVAPTLMVLGKGDMARGLLEESFIYAERRCGKGSSVAAIPALMFAEALYDVGELDRAGALIDEYLPSARQWGMVDEIAAGFITSARLDFAKGNVKVAMATLEEAHLIAVECRLDRLRATVVSEQVRMMIQNGQLGAAEEALNAGDIIVEGFPYPTLTPTRKNEHIAIAWLRIEIQRFNLAKAKKVAMRWLEFVKRSAAKQSIVIFQLLLAEIALLEGDRVRGRRALREALEAAEPAGWTQVFLDEGDGIKALLTESYASGPVAQTPVDAFTMQILALLGVKPDLTVDSDVADSCLVAQLGEREVQILTMINGGLRNREIGDRLGLTEGTVKWYMQQIFDKLGVRRRSQAVLRARVLGIFA